MSLKRIHINQHIIKANKKNGTNDPPITIKEAGANTKAYGVLITGPSCLLYSPDRPLKCGARLWLETTSEIKLLNTP